MGDHPNDPATTAPSRAIVARMITRTVWGGYRIPVAVRDCLCPDGSRRAVRLTGDADTFFSIPARVVVRVPDPVYGGTTQTTVTGFVTGRDTDDPNDLRNDYEFVPYAYGKNGDIFDRIIAAKPTATAHACATCHQPLDACDRTNCPGRVPF